MELGGLDKGFCFDADEAAAVIAALSTWLDEDRQVIGLNQSSESPWRRAAKLESQGIAVDESTLRSGWRL